MILICDVTTGDVWTMRITALGVTLGVFLQIITAILSALRGRAAAKQVAEVKQTTMQTAQAAVQTAQVAQQTAQVTDKKLGEIHELVNGGMTTQKEITKIVTRQLADEKGTPTAIALADIAEKSYQDQLIKAANATLSDAKKGP